MSLRQELEGIWKSTGKKPAHLEDEPEFYPAVAHIWQWYLQLSGTRGGGFGPAPLTYVEIDAWKKIMQTDATPWEVEQIKTIDHLYLDYLYEKQKAEEDT